MLQSILEKFFDRDRKTLNEYSKILSKVNEFEKNILSLSQSEMIEEINHIKTLIKEKKKSFDDVLPEVFALTREAGKRALNMRHFDVQILGGIAMHQGHIVEMMTGEGKTLIATLSAVLNSLSGCGVHVVTTNDYLAKRDCEWMKKIYEYLGLSVGYVVSSMEFSDKKKAYDSDITYVTNNELGFDYLRDNMAYDTSQILLRELNYAIVDEADSILIDEARTPLIISGVRDKSSEMYIKIDKIVKQIPQEMVQIDHKNNFVELTDEGTDKVENLLIANNLMLKGCNLYDSDYVDLQYYVNKSLQAINTFHKNKDYIVKNDQVLIVDEFTGRVMDGRRYGNGLHQAIEAKEGVEVQNENQTLATITYQNLFRLYKKISGMTGTAKTEEKELFGIYGTKVLRVPTNKPLVRKDLNDLLYFDEEVKFKKIIEKIIELHNNGQPILIGTATIEKSEVLSKLLTKQNILHNVLNAKNHEKEAHIISQAGKLGAVTIATNMAGRGTDIKLGGNLEEKIFEALNGKSDISEMERADIIDNITQKHQEEFEKVLKVGGLFVLGSERHESRRIDNQLCGRAGRQGDPGTTQFYLSLQDPLLRNFVGEKLEKMFAFMKIDREEVLHHKILNNSIARAQKNIENMHYEMRKNVLKYDEVMRMHRDVFYSKRQKILNSSSLEVINIFVEESESFLQNILQKDQDVNELLLKTYNGSEEIALLIKEKNLINIDEDFILKISDNLKKIYAKKIEQFGQSFELAIRSIALSSLDSAWTDHLYRTGHLRDGIFLRSYAQKDPFNEYQIESFNMFMIMMTNYSKDLIYKLINIQISKD